MIKFKHLLEIFTVSTKLGLTSFGGPMAHLGYFHHEYIRKRKWIAEDHYADLVALCQFLPGPASSQVGIGIGLIRGGILGGFLAWLGFTLPSVIVLVLFAYLLQGMEIGNLGWIHGLKIVAIAIVAQAVISMGQKLTPDRGRVTIAIIAMAITLLWANIASQILIIIGAGLLGLLLYKDLKPDDPEPMKQTVSRHVAVIALVLFFLLLISLPILRQVTQQPMVALFDSLYRSGSLVFGGGHVVLPFLEREVVPTGWVSQEEFLAGYGATQAVPGPLFTFASYLGVVAGGLPGAIIGTIAIFLPAFLLIVGTLPFWDQVRRSSKMKGALTGIQAAVVGILLAALYHPLWSSTIHTPKDFVLVGILFILLVFWKFPPLLVVLIGAIGGMIIGL